MLDTLQIDDKEQIRELARLLNNENIIIILNLLRYHVDNKYVWATVDYLNGLTTVSKDWTNRLLKQLVELNILRFDDRVVLTKEKSDTNKEKKLSQTISDLVFGIEEEMSQEEKEIISIRNQSIIISFNNNKKTEKKLKTINYTNQDEIEEFREMRNIFRLLTNKNYLNLITKLNFLKYHEVEINGNIIRGKSIKKSELDLLIDHRELVCTKNIKTKFLFDSGIFAISYKPELSIELLYDGIEIKFNEIQINIPYQQEDGYAILTPSK